MTSPVYTAVYSGVPVYEMLCRSVAVMRRREDSYLNATQILKVAGVDKGRRTKILEREVQVGEHEKVQGGYGKYQGTWIPFDRGLEIARQYGVEDLLRPLLEHVPSPDDDIDTPKKKKPAPKPRPVPVANDYDDIPRLGPPATRKNSDVSGGAYANGTAFNQFQLQQQLNSMPAQHRPPTSNMERYRAILMSVFLNHENHRVPELLTNTNPPADLDIDLVIDDQGHTSLHWAAALARLNILQLLLNLGADARRVNFNGESALIRAVLVTNNFDNDSFYNLLSMLQASIDIVDKKGRTVFHHIALTAGIKGRAQASKYYLEVLIDMMKKSNLDISAIIDRQDKNGDTALNIACRISNYNLVEQLLREGSSTEVPNRAGLRPVDFGLEDPKLAELFDAQKNGVLPKVSASESKPVDPASIPTFGLDHSAAYKRYSYTARGREMAGEFESVVANLEAEIGRKDAQLQEAIAQIRNVSQELSTSRRVIQQLALKVADLQGKLKTNGIAEEVEPISITHEPVEGEDIPNQEAELAKLRAIVKAHGLSAEDAPLNPTTLPDGTTTGEGWEMKAQALISKVLQVPIAQLSGPGGMIDPLMAAVSSEKNIGNLDKDVGNLTVDEKENVTAAPAAIVTDEMQDVQ